MNQQKQQFMLLDKRLSTMLIDKNVVESANCRRFCPALMNTAREDNILCPGCK